MDKKDSKKSILRELWKETFGDSDTYLNLIFENLYSSDYSLMCDQEGRLTEEGEAAAGLLGIPYDFVHTASGTKFRGLYLCGLATRPNYRRRGLMGHLMKEIENRGAKDGFDFLFLIPADEHLRHYYEKAGFTSAFQRIRTVISASSILEKSDIDELKEESHERVTESVRPFYDDTYMGIARAENEESGGECWVDEMKSTEIFVEPIETENGRCARIRYARSDGGEGLRQLLKKAASRFDTLEFLLPSPLPPEAESMASLISENPKAKVEEYAMLKPLYENPEFAIETSIDLKKSILANTPITTWLMLD